jgi:hypothetical protein
VTQDSEASSGRADATSAGLGSPPASGPAAAPGTCPWQVQVRTVPGTGYRLLLDPGAAEPVATWLEADRFRGLSASRLQRITGNLSALLDDMCSGAVLEGAFDPAVFRPLFATGQLEERPRVRSPHLAGLELVVVEPQTPAGYSALCQEVAIETRRLQVPGGGRLTAFHVRLPVVQEPCTQVQQLELALLRHELLHAFAAQMLGFGGHDAGRGLDPLCVSAETPGCAPAERATELARAGAPHTALSRGPHAAPSRGSHTAPSRGPHAAPSGGPPTTSSTQARVRLEADVGDELRRRVARAVGAVADPHARLRVVQRIVSAFVAHWERNPRPMRPAAWRRVMGAGGDSVEEWCAGQPAPVEVAARSMRASLALSAAEACIGGWARLRGPCDALAEVVHEEGEPLLVLRSREASPGRVDAEGWLALAAADPEFAAFVRRSAGGEPGVTLRAIWARWWLDGSPTPPSESKAVHLVTVGLDTQEEQAWSEAARRVSWLDIRWDRVGNPAEALEALNNAGSGPALVVAGGTVALDHIVSAELIELSGAACVERLYLRAVEVAGVLARIDGRGLYQGLNAVRLAVPAFEPWLRWSGGASRPLDPRFRVEGWVPGGDLLSSVSPPVLLAGATRLHRERVDVDEGLEVAA